MIALLVGCYFLAGCVLAFAACWFVNVCDFGDRVLPEYSDRAMVWVWAQPCLIVFFWPLLVPAGIVYFTILFLSRFLADAAYSLAQEWKDARWKRARERITK